MLILLWRFLIYDWVIWFWFMIDLWLSWLILNWFMIDLWLSWLILIWFMIDLWLIYDWFWLIYDRFWLILIFFFVLSLSLSQRMEQLLFVLLLLKGMNKLFKFYWKKEEQILIFQLKYFDSCFWWIDFFFVFFLKDFYLSRMMWLLFLSLLKKDMNGLSNFW